MASRASATSSSNRSGETSITGIGNLRWAAMDQPTPTTLLAGLDDRPAGRRHRPRRLPLCIARRCRLRQDPGAHPAHRLARAPPAPTTPAGSWPSPSPGRPPPSSPPACAPSGCATACGPAPSTPSPGPSCGPGRPRSGAPPPVLLDRPARLLARVGRPRSARARRRSPRAGLGPRPRHPARRATRPRRRRAPGGAPASAPSGWSSSAAATSRRSASGASSTSTTCSSSWPTPIDRRPRAAPPAQRWRFAAPLRRRVPGPQPAPAPAARGVAGRPRRRCTVVGDPNQAIYGWNGSDPTLHRAVRRPLPGRHRAWPSTATTGRPRRSSRSPTPCSTPARSAGSASGPCGARARCPTSLGYADADEEAGAVARAVLDAKVPGTRWGHQAVLARTNAQLDAGRGGARAPSAIPVRVAGRTPFHELPGGPRRAARAGRRGASLRRAPSPRARRPRHRRRAATPTDDERRRSPGSSSSAERYRAATRPAATAPASGPGSSTEVDDDRRRRRRRRRSPSTAPRAGSGRSCTCAASRRASCPIARARRRRRAHEERRLFYVACTRAEQRLRLTLGGAPPLRRAASRAERRPSPYLAELAPILARLRRGAPSRPAGLPPLVPASAAPARDPRRSDRADALRSVAGAAGPGRRASPPPTVLPDARARAARRGRPGRPSRRSRRSRAPGRSCSPVSPTRCSPSLRG